MNEVKKDSLFEDVSHLIEETKASIAINVNSSVNELFWQIGKRIKEELLQNQKPEYGSQIVENLSQSLGLQYGKGYSRANLFHFIKLFETFPSAETFNPVSKKLTFTHLRSIIYLEDEIKRDFYMQLCQLENWSTRTLRERIKSMLYERTAISKKPEETIKYDLELLKNEQQLSADLIFRDPYLLDFLGLSDKYSEKDLESAILAELQRFIIEMGQDFAFLARQKRITIDNRDYYIDLLFYHRRLKCLVVIDLKIGEFEAGYKGSMELYLRYLEKYDTVEGENLPIGLILCAGKNDEHIELLQLDKSNIRVAEYLTQLPSKELLQAKLHQSIEIARHKLLKSSDE